MAVVQPLFSVIIPTHDRAALVPRAIASVLGQTLTDIEVVVVDDASAERPVLPDDPRIRLVCHDVNRGPAAARNTGVGAATGQYLTFLDDDDVWVPERLELALAGLARAPIALCWARYRDEIPSPKRVLDGDVRDVILDSVAPSLIVTAVERSAFLPFDERFRGSEDAEWWLRTSQVHEVATVPRFGALVTRRPNAGEEPQAQARLDDGLRLLAAHADWFAEHPRAAAMRWQRIGFAASAMGDHSLARRAFLRSLRLYPRLRAAVHLARA